MDGVLWAGPIADGLVGILAPLLVRREMQSPLDKTACAI